MTAFYSMRLLYAAFFTTSQGNKKVLENAHEPSFAMTIPLVILAVFSIYIGYLMRDLFVGVGSPFLEFVGQEKHHGVESEFIST